MPWLLVIALVDEIKRRLARRRRRARPLVPAPGTRRDAYPPDDLV